jgi:outer membrane murein-binding lipoprotein Lpp
MKKILLLIVLFFLVGCVSKSELESAIVEISELESQITQQESNIEELESQVQSLNESSDRIQSDFDDLNEDYDTLSEDKESLQIKYSDTSKELQAAEHLIGRLICDEKIDMEYENIFDVSTILAGWWARQSQVESVKGTYRDHIWNNTDTKIHSVQFTSSQDHQPYVEHFLVFFDEFGWNTGVFWLSKLDSTRKCNFEG